MRLETLRRARVAITCVGLVACSSTLSPLGPPADLTITTLPDFSARVFSVQFESVNGPAGPYQQHDVSVIIAPSISANAGVVVPTAAPVFVRTSAGTFASDASRIRAGDLVEVWHDFRVALGATQGPPGAPTYTGTQIVIDR